jgi:outer membrane receptor protein involved in Fe transport
MSSRGRFFCLYRWLPVVLLCFLACTNAGAQTSRGVISGRVVDTTGAVIPGATVTLISSSTGTKQDLLSSETGDFVFAAVLPGTYEITVELPGMKRLSKTNINMTASERLALGNFQLEVGDLTESITVETEGAQVQTQSAERSAVLTASQVQALASLSREVVALTKTMPGVVSTPGTGSNVDDAAGAAAIPNISGLRLGFSDFNVDGVSSITPASASRMRWPVNMDAVGEMKVLLNTYSAEYGRSGGAIVNILIKSGTRDFHGGGYWYKRHEQFNANDYFNNRERIGKPVYRFGTYGWSLGGPIALGNFNKNRDRLFFFYSGEQLRTSTPRPLEQMTVPTQLERQGNFAQTLDTNGRLIVIRDPLTNQPFPGNIIPANRIDANGQKLLQQFPLPNQLDRAITGGNYNYNFQENWNSPKGSNVVRVDTNFTDRLHAYFRYSIWHEGNIGYGVASCNTAPIWGYTRCNSRYDNWSATTNVVYAITPNLVHEFQLAANLPRNYIIPLDKIPTRTELGITIPQGYPQTNAYNIPPWTTYGGVPRAATNSNLRQDFPKSERHRMFNLTDSLSWIKGAHTFKFGFSADQVHVGQGLGGAFAGQFAFGRDVNNPNDSNYAYSNAVLGNFLSYTEITNNPTRRQLHQQEIEWYTQDNWKVNPKLTLDYGVRWTLVSPEWDPQGLASFVPSAYDPKKAVLLYQPVMSGGQRLARNPVNGTTAPAVYIGAIVPGTGDLLNGLVSPDNPMFNAKGFSNRPPLLWGPRFGFAFDPGGDGKTAIRGGGGVMYTWQIGASRAAVANPPKRFTPSIFYSNLRDFSNATAVNFPSAITGNDPNLKVPTIYNYSLGVQRDIGFGTVVDIGYVGNLGRHLRHTVNINQLPYGQRFLASSLDTTTNRPLPDNFIRPYVGYGNITYSENAGSSNYNSLQVQANRRFTRSIQFGASWTWSKSMDFSSGETDQLPTYADRRAWSYSVSDHDRTHVASVNAVMGLPAASKLWNNGFVRGVFDNWQMTAIGNFSTGAPTTITFTTVDSVDLTGGGDGARPVMVGNPILPKGERSLDRYINTAAFARPRVGDRGNTPRNSVRGAGINNWDLSFLKEFPVKERLRMQFRWEMFNAFNHTQFQSMDTVARFDAAGNQVNSRFGSLIDATPARKMQGSLRISF